MAILAGALKKGRYVLRESNVRLRCRHTNSRGGKQTGNAQTNEPDIRKRSLNHRDLPAINPPPDCAVLYITVSLKRVQLGSPAGWHEQLELFRKRNQRRFCTGRER